MVEGRVDCLPEQEGYDSERLIVLKEHFNRLIREGKIQGAAYCISRNGKVIANQGLGTAHYYDRDGVMLPDTIHGIASITKMFTAVALMKLVEDGKTRLDVKVGEILPQLSRAPYHEITLFHLLTHTSGLNPDRSAVSEPDYPNVWEEVEKAAKDWKAGSAFDWITPALKCGMNKKPGEAWQYCSFGFVLLGAVIETLTGRKAERYIEEAIIEPLGLKDTFFQRKEAVGRINVIWEEDRKDLLRQADGTEERPSVWAQIPSTEGGLCSTPYDLIRFAHMLLEMGTLDGKRILGRKAVEKMTASSLSHVPDHCWGAKEEDRQYGIGIDMREGPGFLYSKGTYLHEGSGSCALVIDPKEKLAAAWFVPFRPGEWYAQALWNVSNIIWSGLQPAT